LTKKGEKYAFFLYQLNQSIIIHKTSNANGQETIVKINIIYIFLLKQSKLRNFFCLKLIAIFFTNLYSTNKYIFNLISFCLKLNESVGG